MASKQEMIDGFFEQMQENAKIQNSLDAMKAYIALGDALGDIYDKGHEAGCKAGFEAGKKARMVILNKN